MKQYINMKPLPNQLNEDEAHELLDRFYELGGNFIDTANMYSQGRSEAYVGSWLEKRQCRDSLVLATKVRYTMSGDPNGSGLSRKHILREVDASLRRLQTTYIDLYQIHCPDWSTPIEETLRTLQDLIQSGKIHYFGLSNVTGFQMQRVVDFCRHSGMNPCVSLQQHYCLLSRESEVEAFEVCNYYGIGILPWSPLKGGLLSGKFRRGQDVSRKESTSRVAWATSNKQYQDELSPGWDGADERTLQVLDALVSVAESAGRAPAQVAIKWLLQKRGVSSVVIGARSLAQLEENIVAGDDSWSLTSEQMKLLDEVSAQPPHYPYKFIAESN